ncbi:MAG: glutamate formimidoyltransferase [Anaerolineales bacterium]|jgi:glutamate formiminotransferase/formiminotetrahydrofolate cyclodeaminase
MTHKLVECIPNFSEGRRPEVIEAIEAAIRGVPRIHVLDRHSDADHNRTVITFAGPPEAVLEAAYGGIAKAAELIDLDQHEGEHPRIGATDVVPFVPLSGVSMDDCVQLAQRLGERVSEELGIPVYLYERAATRPERTNLENIRRGEYEGLKEAIGSDPEKAPDYGPASLGKAGATVIGARPPLIAFNVYLDTDDVSIAKKTARAVRQSSGGLPYVKALGMEVDGLAQVSMNLTDFTETAVHRVVEAIREEAARQGASIHHSELVGLIPQQALIAAAQWYLQLTQFEPDQVLETRLYAAREKQTFLERLAAGTATPGGGSAAAYAGAMAAALVGMVARLTIGKKKYAKVEARMKQIAAEADELRIALEEAVARDAQAFDRVMAAYRLPKDTDGEKAARREAIEDATRVAGEVPLEVARQAVEVAELAAEVAEVGNASAITDTASAGAMARVALTAASLNVRVNAASLADKKMGRGWLKKLEALQAQAEEAEGRVQKAVNERMG